MEYRKLGQAGVKVSRICLGTAFRAFWNGQSDEGTCIKVIEKAIELGCNFLDCANYYFGGRCEEVLGRAVAGMGKRDDLFITSKVWSPIGEGPNDRGLSRFHIMREVERSLKRLRLDHLDLYLLHNWDAETPLEETLRAMDDLVRQGKARYVGACNFSAAQAVEALWVAQAGGYDPLACLQNHYNLLHRQECEPELLPRCRRHGLGMMTYSPLAIGLLSGRFRRGQTPPPNTPWSGGQYDFEKTMTPRADRVVQTLIDLAAARDATPAQVAIAWILDHPEISAPIIGPDYPEQVEEVFGALELKLTLEERAALDQASAEEEKP
ncbi:MAG: aldo/keto reductase [Candidatus Handelsmanbacteria bacterium]|nr:aldo/keto reductase [Candidatus Handelsmanbacteria bacterium]